VPRARLLLELSVGDQCGDKWLTPAWLACSTHAYVDMKFPSKSAGEKNEKVKCVDANVFLCRLVMYLLATNLVLIAFGADVFFWVARIKA
jgi:hypothetical protein